MLDEREREIVEFLLKNKEGSSKEIFEELSNSMSYATVKRILTKLHSENLLDTKGKGKATKYHLSSVYLLIHPIDPYKYFEKEIDQRVIKERFDFQLINEILFDFSVFTIEELNKLTKLQSVYKSKVAELSKFEYKKELERLAIDLSWKSSQIEGNTYSLLETERLLKEKETASGKSKEEASMLLNHKVAIDFIIEHPDYLSPLSIQKVEDINSLLVKELEIEKNLRRKRVGISGTNYKPLDNEYQIKDAILEMCRLINHKDNVFEKAILALVLISYIQPFMDGNKRTARIVSNAILMNAQYCPMSYRTVDSIEYKKAMLIFYEQNNIFAIKKIFIDQFEFAVNTYF